MAGSDPGPGHALYCKHTSGARWSGPPVQSIRPYLIHDAQQQCEQVPARHTATGCTAALLHELIERIHVVRDTWPTRAGRRPAGHRSGTYGKVCCIKTHTVASRLQYSITCIILYFDTIRTPSCYSTVLYRSHASHLDTVALILYHQNMSTKSRTTVHCTVQYEIQYSRSLPTKCVVCGTVL